MKKRKKNNKVYIIIAIVMAVICIGSGIFYFVNNRGSGTAVIDQTKDVVYSYDESEFTASVSKKSDDGVIYMPTDFDGIYYTLSLQNEFNLYTFNGGDFAPLDTEIKTISTNLAATYETIPVTVNYFEKDGKIFGCGVYTSENKPDNQCYEFAFAKLCNKPAGYGEGYLLLADFNKYEMYRQDKSYSEIYNFNLNTGAASTYVSNNTRLIDKNGTFRQDWTILNDVALNNLGTANYFLSSRYYSQDETGKRSDIMVLSSNYRPTIVAEDILGTWFYNDEQGLKYLKKNQNGFALIQKNGEEEKELRQFDGDFFENYVVSGNYILNKSVFEIYDLAAGTGKTFLCKTLSGCTDFKVNKAGNKAVFLFDGEENTNGVKVQSVIFASADGSVAEKSFNEPLLYSESASFSWADDNTLIFARATSGTGEAVATYTVTY